MINSKEPLTGEIETDNKTYSFYLNNYSMVFWDAVNQNKRYNITQSKLNRCIVAQNLK